MNRGETRTGVRDLLNEPSPGAWTNDILNRFINSAFLEVYAEMTQSNEGYFGSTFDISLVSGTQMYNMPTTNAAAAARLLFVERRDLEVPFDLTPIPLQEKNRYERTQLLAGQEAVFRYFQFGNQIGFTPTPRITVASAIRCYLVAMPTLPSPVGTTDDAFEWPVEITLLHHDLMVWLAFIRAITKDRELVALHMPQVSRLWDLLKVDKNRKQYQEPIGFSLPEDVG